MEERYSRNVLTEEEQNLLWEKKIFIAGCGGLGEIIVEDMTRIGIGEITICDYDDFTSSNLNRQIFCTERTMGQGKVDVAKLRIKEVNLATKVNTFRKKITSENAEELILGHDLVVDGLDNVNARLALEKACEKLNIPYIFGGVDGEVGQVGTVMPSEHTVSKLFKASKIAEKPNVAGYAVSCVASIECAEAVNVLLGRSKLENKLLLVSLKDFSMEIMDL